MQLDKFTIVSRPRSSWQSFDLGCRLAVQHYKSLLLVYVLSSLPFFVVANLISVEVGIVYFWLFKPWYERGLLFMLSRRVFAEKTGVFDTVRRLPKLLKPLWFSSITFRRFSPSRSFDLSVTLLEGLSGDRRQKRLRVLHNTVDDNSALWTFCCLCWEIFLVFALIGFLQLMLVQEFQGFQMFSLFSESYNTSVTLLSNVIIYVAMCVIAPFYVSGGFAAYLNRRTVLEGWDIELGFKQWMQELKDKNVGRYLSCIVVTGALIFTLNFSFTPQVAASQEAASIHEPTNEQDSALLTDDTEQEIKRINQDLDEVFNAPPFGGKKTVTKYRLKESLWQAAEEKQDAPEYAWIQSLIRTLSTLFEFILWVVFGACLLYLVYRNRHLFKKLKSQEKVNAPDIELPSFLDESEDKTDTSDVTVTVNHYLSSGKVREATSVLLKATLTELVKYHRVKISKGMTENECLNEISKWCDKNITSFANELMQIWIHIAWAHQSPQILTVEDLLARYLALFELAPESSKENEVAGEN